MFLLTFIPEGLEPSEILSILADDKTLKNLQKTGTIKYDFKRKQREVKKKLIKKGVAKYFKTVERGNITTPQKRTNIINELIKLEAVERNNKKIKLTDDYLRQGTKILLINHLFSHEPRFFNFLDKKNLEIKEKRVIEAYSKSFNDFSDSENKQIEKHLIEMNTSLKEIKRILSENIVSKWLEQVRDFYKSTNNERIKKAIMDGIAVHLFQMINLPFFIFEKCRNQKLTEFEYNCHTGRMMVKFLVEATHLERDWEKNKKQLYEAKKDIKKIDLQFSNGKNSKDIYADKNEEILEKARKLLDAQSYNIEQTHNLYQFKNNRLDSKEEIKKSDKNQIFPPKPIMDEMIYICDTIQKDGKYDINQFCKIWSEYFFWKDYNFTIHDIEEILDWTWSKSDVLRDIYVTLDFVITSSVRCDEIISEMLVGLGNESTDWSFMPLIIK